MNQSDAVNELADLFVALNDQLHTVNDREEAMPRLVELAVKLVPGCDAAAVTVWPVNRPPYSRATTGEEADEVDRIQYTLREGPCLTAAADADPIRIFDIAQDTRFPRFSAAVLEHTPVRAVMSFRLSDEPNRAALNLYACTTGAFDNEAFHAGTVFAAHARIFATHLASADKAANLELALDTSRLIGAAVGILMSAYKIPYEEAFRLLRTSSQTLHRKLRDVADDVRLTGSLPEEQ
jgi:hypothetical protein